MKQGSETLCGWRAPCVAFDYAQLERIALHECEVLKERLELAKKRRTRTAEQELMRRREVRVLQDMYYEQRGNALDFAMIRKERGEPEQERKNAAQI